MSFIWKVGLIFLICSVVADTADCREMSYSFEESSSQSAIDPAIKVGQNCKWSLRNKEMIDSLFEQTKARAPGLMSLVAIKSPVKLLIFDDLITFPKGERCLAFSTENCLAFSTDFFSSSAKEQTHCFVHEITHIADSNKLAAYSTEWVRLASPFISVSSGSREPVPVHSDRWPSAYGKTDLLEALAEYCSCYVSDRFFPSKAQFEQEIVPLIIKPTRTVILWNELIHLAKRNINLGQYQLAESQLHDAAQLIPSSLWSSHYLACISARSGDLSGTISNTCELISKFDALQLPSKDTLEIDCLKIIANNFIYSGENAKCVSFLELLCLLFPSENWFEEKRAWCVNRRDHQKQIPVNRLRLNFPSYEKRRILKF